jgi:hypothetical protein
MSMRYPDPQLLAQRCLILLNKRGEPYVAYRSNPLNPTPIWGKPVPYTTGSVGGDPESVILTFEDYVAPYGPYSPALQLTSDLPANTPPDEIRFTPAPNSKVNTLRSYGEYTSKKSIYQQMMVQMRDSSIERLFHKMLKFSEKMRGTLRADDMPLIIDDVATLMCVSPDLVTKVLRAKGVDIPKPSVGVFGPRTTGRDHRFSTSPTSDHAYKFKALKSAVHQCRVNAADSGFVLQDFYAPGKPGGYPTHCPVLGVEMFWDEPASYYAPRVGRLDITVPHVSGNVVLMSMLARKMTEGLTVSALPQLLKSNPEYVVAFRKWCTEHVVKPNPAIEKAMKATPVPPVAPPTPTPEPIAPTTTETPPVLTMANVSEITAKILEGWD